MLLFNDSGFKIGGASIFPDHKDPLQFWYLPTEVRLAERDGVAVFTLLRYRNMPEDEVAGGGFLTCEVNLRMTDEQIKEAEREIKKKLTADGVEGEPILAPVPFEEGQVKVIALDLEGDQILGSASPSLYGDNTAMFSLTLDQKYVNLLMSVFDSQDKSVVSPIGVVFDLKFRALRPRLQFTAKAQMERVMEEFKVGVGANIPIKGIRTKADIQAGLRQLEEDGVIDIKVTTFDDSEDVEKLRKEAMDYFTDTMLTEFFVPQLAMRTESGQRLDLTSIDEDAVTGDDEKEKGTSGEGEEKPSGDNDSIVEDLGEAGLGIAEQLLPSVTFKFDYTKDTEDRERTYIYNDSKAQSLKYYPQGFFTLLLDGQSNELLIRDVDLNDDFFKRLTVNVDAAEIDYERLELISTHFEMEYDGDRPSSNEDGVFTPARKDRQTYKFFLNDALDLDYQYTIEYNFRDTENGELATYKTAWLTTKDRSILLNPPRDLGFLQFEISLENDFQWSGIKSVIAHINYTGPKWNDEGETWQKEKLFLFRPGGQTTYNWLLRTSDPDAKAFSYNFEYRLEDNTVSKTEPETGNVAAIIVPDLIGGRKAVDFILNLNADETAYLEVSYEDHDSGYKWHKELNGRDNQILSVSIPIPNRDQTAYSYKTTIVNSVTSEVQENTYPPQNYGRVVRVDSTPTTMIPIDISTASINWGEINRADVTVRYTEAGGNLTTKTIKFEPADDTRYSFMVAKLEDGRSPRYDWFVMFYTDDGSVRYPATSETFETSDLREFDLGDYTPQKEELIVLFDANDVDWEVVDEIRLEMVDGTQKPGPNRGTKERHEVDEDEPEYEWEPNTIHPMFEWRARFKFKQRLNGKRSYRTDWQSGQFASDAEINLQEILASAIS